jgi:FixJ family two-component response regulator
MTITVRDATKALVRSLGYNNASMFASADEFLKSEQVHDTSCLITDVQMPGLSGLDLQFKSSSQHAAPGTYCLLTWRNGGFS